MNFALACDVLCVDAACIGWSSGLLSVRRLAELFLSRCDEEELVVQFRHLEFAQSVPANHTIQHMGAQFV